MVKLKNKLGKIIVIDGIDGSGKKTQTELLVKRLKKEKINGKPRKVVRIDFPQYEKNFFGKLLKTALSDTDYNFLKIHPEIASVIYAADRWETLEKLNKFLTEGYIVILDRYVSSNQIHQGGKILKNPTKRKEFMKWLDVLEHKIFKLPKPDLILYLSLELSTVQNLLKSRAEKDSSRIDLVDKDLEYQTNSRESALKLSGEIKNMQVIKCDNINSEIKSIIEINDIIYTKVIKTIN